MVGHLVLIFDVAGDGMVYVTGSECAATREEVDASMH
jgi:hypothetical protein